MIVKHINWAQSGAHKVQKCYLYIYSHACMCVCCTQNERGAQPGNSHAYLQVALRVLKYIGGEDAKAAATHFRKVIATAPLGGDFGSS